MLKRLSILHALGASSTTGLRAQQLVCRSDARWDFRNLVFAAWPKLMARHERLVRLALWYRRMMRESEADHKDTLDRAIGQEHTLRRLRRDLAVAHLALEAIAQGEANTVGRVRARNALKTLKGTA